MRAIFIVLVLFIYACSKQGVITSTDAALFTSTDSLHFDTVFTTQGSVTGRFKIFNPNTQALVLSNVQLAGGNASTFSINVNGFNGPTVQNISIAAGDSAYVFAVVRINPNSANTPFLVQDSIRIHWNGNTKWVQLSAYGQNARFLQNIRVTTDTAWTNSLPIVVLGGVRVNNGATLTIQPGTRVFTHATAPFLVDGTVRSMGTAAAPIVFRGLRIDEPYNSFPASWPGLVFTAASSNNILQYTKVLNAYQAVVAGAQAGTSPKLTMLQCEVNNAFDAGVWAINSRVNAVNCLLVNSGKNLVIQGGVYSFTHCTVAALPSPYFVRTNATASITNLVNNVPVPTQANFTNCIVFGQGSIIENELQVGGTAAANFQVSLINCLYRVKDDPPFTTVVNSLKNQLPLFDSLPPTQPRVFTLQAGSAAVNRGVNAGVSVDILGNPRPVGLPDLGCYERQ